MCLHACVHVCVHEAWQICVRVCISDVYVEVWLYFSMDQRWHVFNGTSADTHIAVLVRLWGPGLFKLDFFPSLNPLIYTALLERNCIICGTYRWCLFVITTLTKYFQFRVQDGIEFKCSRIVHCYYVFDIAQATVALIQKCIFKLSRLVVCGGHFLFGAYLFVAVIIGMKA